MDKPKTQHLIETSEKVERATVKSETADDVFRNLQERDPSGNSVYDRDAGGLKVDKEVFDKVEEVFTIQNDGNPFEKKGPVETEEKPIRKEKRGINLGDERKKIRPSPKAASFVAQEPVPQTAPVEQPMIDPPPQRVLEDLKASVAQEKKGVTPETLMSDDPYVILEQFKGAPPKAQIEHWKSIYNNKVFILTISMDEAYIMRAIDRQTYQKLYSDIMSKEETQMRKESLLQEEIVRRCMLWPQVSPGWYTDSAAGTIPTLFEMTMELSNFINPALAMQLVRKL